jgi:hypothetical protein
VTAPRLLLPVAAAALSLAAGGPASAQVRWDAGAEAGVMKRVETGGGAGAPTAGLGPSVQLQGHVALLPMIRLGAYVATDLAPAVGGGATADGPRTFAEAGLQVRVTPPLLPWPFRTWLLVGLGDVYTHDLGTRLSGGMLDVPVGLGLGRKLAHGWLLFTELGARFGLAFHGAMYEADRASVPPGGGSSTYEGKDAFALSLSVGLSLEK